MRSRYTAYALQNIDYLYQSKHPNLRQSFDPISLGQWMATIEWTRLEIVYSEKGQTSDTNGTVAFNAYYLQNGKKHLLHEISKFEKLADRWYYTTGVYPKEK